jgi:hypothetical protein
LAKPVSQNRRGISESAKVMTTSSAGQIWYDYRVFGLRIRSSMPLPELLHDAEGGDPDAEIVYGTVPAELAEPSMVRARFEAAAGVVLLRIEGVSRYLVTGGRRVVVEPEPHALEQDVRLFLLSAALSALLHQRHDLVLHGSAIRIDGGCAVFLGRSGAGKSTLALALGGRGYSVLTDDLSVVRAGRDGRLELHAGFPEAKLWLDSLAALDISAESLHRIQRAFEKRALPLEASFLDEALPVTRLYVLHPEVCDEIGIIPVTGSRRFRILRNQTYRFRYLKGSGSQVEHFQTVVQLAQQASIAIVTRPKTPLRVAELADRLELDFRRSAGVSGT